MTIKPLFLQEKKKVNKIKAMEGYRQNVELIYLPCSLLQAQIVRDSISQYYEGGVLGYHKFDIKSHGEGMWAIVVDYVLNTEDEVFMCGFCNGVFVQVMK